MDRGFKAGLIALFLIIISFSVEARVIRSGPNDGLDFQTDGVNSRMEIKTDGTVEVKKRLEVSGTDDLSRPYTTLTETERDALTPVAGDVTFNETSGFLNFFNTVWRVLVDSDSSQTLTNKTLDANSNTFSNFEHGAEVDNPSSGVHGVTGSVVGTTDVQDLSGKTFTDEITVEELASTPTTPATGDKKIYCKTDDKCYQLNDAGVEIELGAGGGGGGAVSVEDEGVELTSGVAKFNFVGAGVTVTEPVADEVEVNVGIGAVAGTFAVSSDWESYTPVFGAGWGTVTNVNFIYRRDGSDLLIIGQWTNGTVSAASSAVALPVIDGEQLLASDKVTTYSIVGTYGNNNPSTDNNYVVIGSGNDAVQFTRNNASPCSVSSCFNTGEDNRFTARIPIQGWSATDEMVLTTIDNDPPASMENHGTNSVGTATTTFIDFGTIAYNGANNFTGCGSGNVTVSGTGCRWIAPRDGVISVCSKVFLDSDLAWQEGERVQMNVYVSGLNTRILHWDEKETTATQSHAMLSSGCADIAVNKNDYVEIALTQNSGGNIALAGGPSNSSFDVHYVDAKSLLSQIDLGTVIAPFVADITRQTDWESFTPTGTWTGAVVYSGKWRRIGDTMEITTELELTGPLTSGGVNLQVDIPDGYLIDTSKVYGESLEETLGISQWRREASGTASYNGTVTYQDTNTVYPLLKYPTVSGNDLRVMNANDLWVKGNGDRVTLKYSVPIKGWSADSTVVITPLEKDQPAKRTNVNTGTIPNNTITYLDFTNSSGSEFFDTDQNYKNCNNGHQTDAGDPSGASTCHWESPRDGKILTCASLQLNGTTDWTAGELHYLEVFTNRDNGKRTRLDLEQKATTPSGTHAAYNSGCAMINVKKGEKLYLGYLQNSGNARIPSGSFSEGHWEISYIDAKSLLSGLEENNTRLLATMSAAHGVSGTADVQFNTIAKQTGTGSYDTGTYTYTVGETGSYNICVGVRWEHGNTPSAGELLRTFININGANTAIARYAFPASPGGGAQLFFPGCKNYELVQGDTVKIQMAESVTPSVSAEQTGSFFQIVKNSSLTIGGNIEPDKFQIKTLQSGFVGDGVVADIGYSNLEIGKCYTYTIHALPSIDTADNDSRINCVAGGKDLVVTWDDNQGDDNVQGTRSGTIRFNATTTTVSCSTNSFTGGGGLVGNGTTSQTWAQLIEHSNGCVETTQW